MYRCVIFCFSSRSSLAFFFAHYPWLLWPIILPRHSFAHPLSLLLQLRSYRSFTRLFDYYYPSRSRSLLLECSFYHSRLVVILIDFFFVAFNICKVVVLSVVVYSVYCEIHQRSFTRCVFVLCACSRFVLFLCVCVHLFVASSLLLFPLYVSFLFTLCLKFLCCAWLVHVFVWYHNTHAFAFNMRLSSITCV